MRNMSFALTQNEYISRTKTVTRRDGWAFLKPGEFFMGVNKVMGFRKGERPIKFHPSLCISNIPEPLNDIIKRPFRGGRYEVVREGFPAWVGKEKEFVKLYMKANGGPEDKIIRRIEFEHYTASDDPVKIHDW